MKKWVVKEVYSETSDVISLLLQNRGISDVDREEFLNPPSIVDYIKKLPPSFKESLKTAKEIINTTIKEDRPIVIHGDYDADGICATAILYKTLTEVVGYKKVLYFIPNRFDHGYGLSLDSVNEIQNLISTRFGVAGGLIITVDCGITAEERVTRQVRESGFKLIITDHHQKTNLEPLADVLLWDDRMVGAGVSLVLSLVLGLRDEKVISLAGIATVTDLAPLRGFNRTLVAKSLKILNANPPGGIKALIEGSGRKPGEISVYDLGYIIGPRLNASGRLESAYSSLELLLNDDPDENREIAHKLHSVNSDRQEMTQKMFSLADEMCREWSEQNVIITSSSEFHEGVIGLVAGKISQKYYRPAIAISVNGEIAKGSARSVTGVNIVELLRHFEDRFLGLGGHPMAAGFSLMARDVELFTSDFIAYAKQAITIDVLTPCINVDLELPLSLMTEELLNHLDLLKPYGIGNPEPLFLSRGVGVVGNDFVGASRTHLSLKLFADQKIYKAIIFDSKNQGIEGFELGSKVDIVYNASVKSFNGKSSVELVIKDIKMVS